MAVNFRSVLIGLLAVVFVCSLTAYNDFALNNTNFVGNLLPVGLTLFLVVLLVCVNGPLSRYRPERALRRGELATILAMGFVGCCLPGAGLMKYLPVLLVSPYYEAGQNGAYANLMDGLGLPAWMQPKFARPEAHHRAGEPVVAGMRNYIPVDHDTLWQHVRAVPWSAWAMPAMMWGILIAALFGAVLCLMAIFRRQWVQNERLPFPLAGIYLSLIEPPAPGRWVNRLLAERGFWIAGSTVFLIHLIRGLHEYAPKHWPVIPIGFDLGTVFSNEPFVYLEGALKKASLQFTMIGVCYFLQSKISFSLWFFFVALNVAEMVMGSAGQTMTFYKQTDQQVGAVFPVAIAIVWVARGHLKLVASRMLPRRHSTTDDPYLSYRWAGWGFVLCSAAVIGWLVAAGCTVAGAVLLTVMLLMTFLVFAKVVAETGMAFTMLPIPLSRPWVYLLADVPAAMAVRTTTRTYYLSNVFFTMFTHDIRECAAGFVGQALRVADGPDPAGKDRSQSPGRRLIPAMLLALVVGYVVAGASYLVVDYGYGATLDKVHKTPINDHAWQYATTEKILAPTAAYAPPNRGPADAHSRLGHFAFGFGLTAVLTALRLRYEWWPLHPVGYLLLYTYSTKMTWFSLFLGWAVKRLLLRVGGSKLYRSAAPWFVGMIVGETAAAAWWLVAAVGMHAMGFEYRSVHVLPD